MRKSVSVAFFSLMSTLLIFGTVIMGGSELVLFSNYFAQERYDVLDEVVNVAPVSYTHLDVYKRQGRRSGVGGGKLRQRQSGHHCDDARRGCCPLAGHRRAHHAACRHPVEPHRHPHQVEVWPSEQPVRRHQMCIRDSHLGLLHQRARPDERPHRHHPQCREGELRHQR